MRSKSCFSMVQHQMLLMQSANITLTTDCEGRTEHSMEKEATLLWMPPTVITTVVMMARRRDTCFWQVC